MSAALVFTHHTAAPGLRLRFAVDPDTWTGDRDLLGPVYDALQILGPLVEPRCADLLVTACDPVSRLNDPAADVAEPAWRLTVPAYGPGVALKGAMADPRVEIAPALSPAAISAWARRALEQPGDVSWAALSFPVSRAAAPGLHGEAIALEPKRGAAISVPVSSRQGQPWLEGPRADGPPTPPIALSFDRDGFEVTLLLERAWSVWTAEGPARDAFEAAIAGLVAAGWERE